ncbi:MAG TPA: site-2 protease family protein [Nitrospirales bacterium]|nr:site-2 protease family protein [Nitrospirales bacterium]
MNEQDIQRDDGWRELPVSILSRDEPAPPPARMRVSELLFPLGLFAATVFTTLWAGAYATKENPNQGAWQFLMQDPGALLRGIPFAGTLMGILVTHELGHYILSRIHRVPASLPLFIPGPPHFIGTFGAIIRMRGPILSRKALFDIGVAGPIAGFVVAVIALVIGMTLSNVISTRGTYGLRLGEPLLLQFVSWLVFGPIPDGYDVVLHPVAFAAWFGLFVTSLNLIPIGQLDGGHVVYAMWGRRQRSIAFAAIPILLALGFLGWPGWFLWAGMAGIIGLAHPPVRDPETLLGRTRVWIGWAAVAIFVLTFAPIPFSVQ